MIRTLIISFVASVLIVAIVGFGVSLIVFGESFSWVNTPTVLGSLGFVWVLFLMLRNLRIMRQLYPNVSLIHFLVSVSVVTSTLGAFMFFWAVVLSQSEVNGRTIDDPDLFIKAVFLIFLGFVTIIINLTILAIQCFFRAPDDRLCFIDGKRIQAGEKRTFFGKIPKVEFLMKDLVVWFNTPKSNQSLTYRVIGYDNILEFVIPVSVAVEITDHDNDFGFELADLRNFIDLKGSEFARTKIAILSPKFVLSQPYEPIPDIVSQSHFGGLDLTFKFNSIEVPWPDGTISVLNNNNNHDGPDA